MTSGANRAGSKRLRAAAQRLESLERSGVTDLPRRGVVRAQPAAEPAATAGTAAPASAAAATKVPVGKQSPAIGPVAARSSAGDTTSAEDRLLVLRTEVSGCQRCPELASTRTQTVFGVGNPRARLCFLGEAPGADEDAKGEPFVGRAGQLLTKIIEACQMKREDIYILNVLKCRPPGNRTPAPDEVANCRGYLDAQLEIIRPEFLCCLGGVAAQTLLETTESIGKLRGRFFERNGIQVVCTYHPAYLLRNPDAKRFVWDDMKMLLRKMGIELGN